MANDKQWFLNRSGHVEGPYSSSQLKELATSHIIDPQTLVRLGTSGPWSHAYIVKGLFPGSSAVSRSETEGKKESVVASAASAPPVVPVSAASAPPVVPVSAATRTASSDASENATGGDPDKTDSDSAAADDNNSGFMLAQAEDESLSVSQTSAVPLSGASDRASSFPSISFPVNKLDESKISSERFSPESASSQSAPISGSGLSEQTSDLSSRPGGLDSSGYVLPSPPLPSDSPGLALDSGSPFASSGEIPVISNAAASGAAGGSSEPLAGDPLNNQTPNQYADNADAMSGTVSRSPGNHNDGSFENGGGKVVPEEIQILLCDDERVLFADNPDLVVLYLELAFGLLVWLFTGFLPGLFLMIQAGFAGGFIWMFLCSFSFGIWGLGCFINWSRLFYVITTRRTIVRGGFLRLTVRLIHHSDIQLITIRSPLLFRLLGLATIEVASGVYFIGVKTQRVMQLYATFAKQKGIVVHE